MSPTFRDRLGSVLMLVFVAVLWMQRDYSSPFGGMFPDSIMILMAIFIVAALILSFTRFATMTAETDSNMDDAELDPSVNHRLRVLVVALLLIAWVLLYRPVGFALTGVFGFASIAWYLGDHTNNIRSAAKALGFAILVSFIVYMVFDYFLLVPLPPGFLFY